LVDAKYHFMSLIAVFLALGLGILLGTALVERGLVSEQKSQIESLRKTFGEIKEKNKELNDSLDYYKSFSDEAGLYLIASRLIGRNYAVITRENSSSETLSKINEAIERSGGRIELTIHIAQDKIYDNTQVVESLASILSVKPDKQAIRVRIFEEVSKWLAGGEANELLNQIFQTGAVKIDGSIDAPLSAVIFLAPSDIKIMKDTDLPLIKALMTAGNLVVGVGDSNCPDEIIKNYKKVGLSTVDHVEMTPGEVALIMLLEGRPGNYGKGEAASRIIPEPS